MILTHNHHSSLSVFAFKYFFFPLILELSPTIVYSARNTEEMIYAIVSYFQWKVWRM